VCAQSKWAFVWQPRRQIDPRSIVGEDRGMKPAFRKLALTSHVTASVGWLGAVVVYLVLAATGLVSSEDDLARSMYLAMSLIGWFVIVPFSVAAVLTGVIQSLGTEWGLFRHYWIIAKLVLAVGGAIVLFVHMRTVSHASGLAREQAIFSADHQQLRVQLIVHAAGGVAILLSATVLSIYKPWGKTRHGRRRTA
jgi:SNF family Na+-dependent transporter